MAIVQAKNTNIIVLPQVPKLITSVMVKKGTGNYFSSTNNYKLVENVITLSQSYNEIKVDYVELNTAQYDPKIAKDLFNFRLSNIEKSNPLDTIENVAKTAQSDRISVEGSKITNVGQILGGFLALTKNTKQNQTVTDEPITAIVTDAVPGITVKKTSSQKSSISTLTGTTAEDGLLNATVCTANPNGIKAALTGPIGATANATKDALKETSTSPSTVVAATNKNIPSTITKEAKVIISKSNRILKNPLGSNKPFGSLGNSFGNILGAVLGVIRGSKSQSQFGDVVLGTPPGFIVPQGSISPENVIEEDGTSNVAKSVKPANNASEKIKSTKETYTISSDTSTWKGAATPVSDGTYKFTTVHTAEELEAELRNTTRKITTGVVHWSKTHSDSPLTARDMHLLHIARQTAAADNDILAVIKQGQKAGLEWHYAILRNGTIERGRPLDIDGGEGVGFIKNTIHIGFIAGYTAPFGTPNSELSLGSASITSEQWKAFDKFLDAFYKANPGGEMLSHREVDKASSCPGFDVSVYVSGKYNKTSIYENPSNLDAAYTPEEQITIKPKKVKGSSTSTIDSAPSAESLSVANVDTTKTQAELDADITTYDKSNRLVLSLQRDLNINKTALEKTENETTVSRSTSNLKTKIASQTTELETLRNDLNQKRKDLMNNGYTYNEKEKTWSKI